MDKDSIKKEKIADTQLSTKAKEALLGIGLVYVADLLQTPMRKIAYRTKLGMQILREIDAFKKRLEHQAEEVSQVQLPAKEKAVSATSKSPNDIHVEDLELSARAYNTLKLNRILTLGEFLYMDMEELEQLDYVSHSIAEELYSCAREHLSDLRFTRQRVSIDTVEGERPLSVTAQDTPSSTAEAPPQIAAQVLPPSSAEVQEPYLISAEAAKQISAQKKPLSTSSQELTRSSAEAKLLAFPAGKQSAPHTAVLDGFGELESKQLDVSGDERIERYYEVSPTLSEGAKETEEPSRDEQDVEPNASKYRTALTNDNRPIEMLSLSVRANNCLKHAKINTVRELAALTHDDLAQLRNLGSKTLAEIEDVLGHLIAEKHSSKTQEDDSKAESVVMPIRDLTPIAALGLSEQSLFYLNMMEIPTIQALLDYPLDELWKFGPESEAEIREAIQTYRRTAKSSPMGQFGGNASNSERHPDDVPIETVGLSPRAYNCLRRAGIMTVQQLLDTSAEELLEIKNLGRKSLEELEAFRKSYVPTIAAPPKTEYSVEELKPMVMDAFVTPFKGLSFEEIKAALPVIAEDSSIKKAVGELLREQKIVYVDYRCYKVYPSFFKYLESNLDTLKDRDREIIRRRYAGDTLETIAQDLGITRERVRQIQTKQVRKLRVSFARTHKNDAFDEDFYEGLYTKCDLPDSFWSDELMITQDSINYLKYTFTHGMRKPEEILNDEDIPPSLRYRVRSFLDRKKIRIDGKLLPRKRLDIEDYALRKYAQEEITFEDFIRLYNDLLEANGIPYDEKLYNTETSLRTRANRFSDSRLCLWKQGERLRYYDIDAGDYSELIEALGLDSYLDTEVSTRKFTNSFPELMEKYDIRDPYELHNLLKKISAQYKLDAVKFNRQPILQFGSFDRTKAITEIMFALAPVTQQDLIEYLHQEYGYDRMTAVGYLTPLSAYYHNGVFDVDYQRIPDLWLGRLMRALTEDFYFLDEIRAIYTKMFPAANASDVNPRSLKSLGFLVYSNYAVQNHPSAESFFAHLLTKDDIYDVQSYFSRFGSIRLFTQTYYELLISHRIFRFAPNQIITLRRLERLNVTSDTIEDYCVAVQDYQEVDSYFTMESLRQDGFAHPLDALGFDDYFYASLLGMDKRFSSQRAFGVFVLFNGITRSRFSIADFIIAQLREYDSVDPDVFIQDISDRYGIVIPNRYEVTMAIKDTELYYDDIMDKIYRDKSLYYADLDE